MFVTYKRVSRFGQRGAIKGGNITDPKTGSTLSRLGAYVKSDFGATRFPTSYSLMLSWG